MRVDEFGRLLIKHFLKEFELASHVFLIYFEAYDVFGCVVFVACVGCFKSLEHLSDGVDLRVNRVEVVLHLFGLAAGAVLVGLDLFGNRLHCTHFTFEFVASDHVVFLLLPQCLEFGPDGIHALEHTALFVVNLVETGVQHVQFVLHDFESSRVRASAFGILALVQVAVRVCVVLIEVGRITGPPVDRFLLFTVFILARKIGIQLGVGVDVEVLQIGVVLGVPSEVVFDVAIKFVFFFVMAQVEIAVAETFH
mmetsp:Transcript_113837/g.244907  ORF Transcript_113837/g.244907 Transcript_113837/m.244907 type:complete len:252 (+) Transcript_113837:890-1645(+)